MLLELVDMTQGTFSRQQILEYLCAVEEKASHPVAQAILKGAQSEEVSFPKHLEVKDHKILKGEGVEGVVNGLRVCVGNQRLFTRLGLLAEEDSNSAVTGYMSIEGHGIVCSFTAADGVRPEAAQVIRGLQRMNIEVMMLTGDNLTAATEVAGKVGLSTNKVNAKLLPEEKLTYIEDLVGKDHTRQACGGSVFKFGSQLVLMCGDGVNDAPALAAGM